ncbi:MAG: hypothetical protein CM1200mP40_35690 [Gammaproteobacteria bacterium]|nr:MAG: hypothetical protein CM1200mP40_35690 [Gammaproteobacteria bacterium]
MSEFTREGLKTTQHHWKTIHLVSTLLKGLLVRPSTPVGWKLPGMLYARVLRSPHPHARIVSIDFQCSRSLTWGADRNYLRKKQK